ncbi:dihydrolipoamide acyltransferase component E2 (DLAT) [Plasmodium ovale curtisi]|uniref:Dihydrolipoamide acyltransferase component E2 (DLAT) n=1 Tax=Plasmodium ovale curtisi TaxID=864141 RepID=A0A1A8VVY7_PLAOA|nr:dihydrolipoamide acyltransferase component E2 (DLAT) [Plasmodium ovale curtisi]
MPALSSTMTMGKIVKWKKNIGDYVNLGDIIMTVESDKADMDVEAFDEGFLRVKHLGDGCEANVGDTLGILTTEEDEQIDDIQVTHDSNDACNSEDDTNNDIEGERNVGMIQEGAYEEKIYVPFTRSKKNRVRINKWIYKENNFVNKDEILFHVEDDKSTIEVESPHTGVIKKILVKEGDFADLDKEIAIISVKKESGKILNEESANNHPVKSEDIDEDNILTHYKNALSGSREGQLFLKSLSEMDEKIMEERLRINHDKYSLSSDDFFGYI